MEFAQKLGRRIRELRKKTGYSQDQAAELAGISGKYLGEIERGEVNATVLVVAKLADALAINLPELLSFGHTRSREALLEEIDALLSGADDDTIIAAYKFLYSILK